MLRRAIPVLGAAAAIGLAGCGDDGGSEPKNRDAAAPRPNESLLAAAKRLQGALPRADCDELIGVMLHSVGRGMTAPDAPPRPNECRWMRREARNELRDLRVMQVEEFGVAGFSEGTGAEARKGQTVGTLWVLDSDGSWKAVFDAIFRPQIDEPPRLQDQADANVRAFVAALRAGDCPAVWRGLNVASRFVRSKDGARDRYCAELGRLYRDQRTAFAQIRADRSAQPRLLGRTRDFSFYSLELRNGRYMAIVLAGQLGGVADDELKDHANPSVVEMLTVRQP